MTVSATGSWTNGNTWSDSVTVVRPDDCEAPVVTDPPATDPPATDPPVTDPPVTDPPETDPPVTEPPATDPCGEIPSGSVASWLTAHGSTGAECFDYEITQECGTANVAVTLQPIPGYRAVWSTTNSVAGPYSEFPATFAEDADGGESTIFWHIRGPEGDYLVNTEIPSYWNGITGTIVVDTDCEDDPVETTEPPVETEPPTDTEPPVETTEPPVVTTPEPTTPTPTTPEPTTPVTTTPSPTPTEPTATTTPAVIAPPVDDGTTPPTAATPTGELPATGTGAIQVAGYGALATIVGGFAIALSKLKGTTV